MRERSRALSKCKIGKRIRNQKTVINKELGLGKAKRLEIIR
jgi:hypothetical protein